VVTAAVMLLVACGAPAGEGSEQGPGVADPAATGPGDGSLATPPAADAGSAPEGEQEAVIEAGTDSAVTGATVEVDPELSAALVEFGQHYLEYDYRVPDEQRIEAMRSLASPELFAELEQPMPPALVESLEREQRVVEAEFSQLAPLEPGVFELAFVVTVSAVEVDGTGAPSTSTSETRTLVVSVGPDQRVTDVR
jgi:hypothetical protein